MPTTGFHGPLTMACPMPPSAPSVVASGPVFSKAGPSAPPPPPPLSIMGGPLWYVTSPPTFATAAPADERVPLAPPADAALGPTGVTIAPIPPVEVTPINVLLTPSVPALRSTPTPPPPTTMEYVPPVMVTVPSTAPPPPPPPASSWAVPLVLPPPPPPPPTMI